MKQSTEKGNSNNNQLNARLRSLAHMRSACQANIQQQQQFQQREQQETSESTRHQSSSDLVEQRACQSDTLGFSPGNPSSLREDSTNTAITEEDRKQMVLEILLSAIAIIDNNDSY